jgi:hypothetical protein
LYNQAVRSMNFILRDVCMLVFPEVVEYLYTSIAESFDIYVQVYNVVRFLLFISAPVYHYQLRNVLKTDIMLVVAVIVNIR